MQNFDYSLGHLQQRGIPVRDAEALTSRALESLNRQKELGLSKLPLINLDKDQISALVAFLNSLTDPCGKSPDCLNKWIPNPDAVDPDGSLLSVQLDE